jgi:UDP-N-acetylglucosamine--N-acetylmuramyl-(pentapeptide) pyrophosphoryl-undecaprenol N-acetylglucosamine transferase
MKIFLVVGGTGGPTAPLLAVAGALFELEPKIEFFLIGTKEGIEKKFLKSKALRIKFIPIPAGKLRRYFSLQNIFDIPKLLAGFFKSIYLIRKYRPDVIFGAGSYVQVPVVWAARLFRIPAIVHQQDFQVLLSTKLSAPAAKAITVSFSYSGKNLPENIGLFAKTHKSKIFVTGNPVREDILHGSKENALQIFNLKPDLPTVLVMGGAAGSANLNRILLESLPELTNYVQIIHVTGEKSIELTQELFPNYRARDFLADELKHAYAAADLVICRGGMSTISELSLLGKAAVIVPLPGSPQEYNAGLLGFLQSAAVVPEKILTPRFLVDLVRKILWNGELLRALQENISHVMPRHADRAIAKLILKIYRQEKK